jgi:GH15 family glucan-1,4-alpha-glucosidase
MTASAALPASSANDPLARRSVEVILEGQDPSGAYVAAPTFPVYGYGWLRDGAFCAEAMDAVGQHASAAAFHNWAARSITTERERAEAAIATIAAGGTPAPEDMLPTRFTLDGKLERAATGHEAWPNFQLDGYGTWLWAVERHLAGARPPTQLEEGLELAARYLAATWRLPCWGCWEEYDDGEHAFTIAAASTGLAAAGRLLGSEQLLAAGTRAQMWLLDRFVADGRFRRCVSDSRVDGSLLWLSLLGVVEVGDPRLEATVDAVRADLVGGSGGVLRYRGDTYYGGGEWVILTCALACYDALQGDAEALERGRAWVQAAAREDLSLPEQIIDHPQSPQRVGEWLNRWGPVATPLLWSHAMYLLMDPMAAGARWSSSR